FSLAMHAWDQPAERLLEIAPQTSAQLLMPMLGQAVEPEHAEKVNPWWREVDSMKPLHKLSSETDGEVQMPKSVAWPMD
ncbi:MAG TPA: hypothetical protein VHL14_06770, partial [Steroidobacteraceae bacterium]|nr:hypothetical protein [Steroidobacteraceae bacterium]